MEFVGAKHVIFPLQENFPAVPSVYAVGPHHWNSWSISGPLGSNLNLRLFKSATCFMHASAFLDFIFAEKYLHKQHWLCQQSFSLNKDV